MKLLKGEPLLFDMDCIIVNMLPYWLDIYNELSGENIQAKDITEYEIRHFVKDPDLFDAILHEEGFFLPMKPMPGAVKYMRKLIDEGHDIVVLTQAPRNSDHGEKEKKEWIKKYFPKYERANMIFAHRKDLVDGVLLFDDKPSHLIHWKERHPKGITATIEFPYNKGAPCDVRFVNQRTAWREFYDFIQSCTVGR